MKYKWAHQSNMKWLGFAVFLLVFCFLFTRTSKAFAYTFEGHYDNKATIWIDKAEIDDNDIKSSNGTTIMSSDILGDGGPSNPQFTKDQVNAFLRAQLVGKYFDSNIYDQTYKYHKESCGDGQNLTAEDESKQKSGNLILTDINIDIKTSTSEGRCVHLFSGLVGNGPSVKITDLNKSNIWFIRKDGQTLIRADGRGGDFSSKDTGNSNIYQSVTKQEGADGRCGDKYPYVVIDDSTKSNPIATGQYESCDNSPGIPGGRTKGREKFGVNIDNQGPGGSGGQVSSALPASSNQPENSCESHNVLDMAWWACGVLGMVNSGIEASTNALDDLLKVNADDWVQDGSIKEVWSYFRALASFTLLGVALIMIIGQAMGGD